MTRAPPVGYFWVTRMLHQRHWTPEQANQLLPIVGATVRRLRDARRRLAERGSDSDSRSGRRPPAARGRAPSTPASRSRSRSASSARAARPRGARPRARAGRLPVADRRAARSTSAGCSTSPPSATGTGSRPASPAGAPLATYVYGTTPRSRPPARARCRPRSAAARRRSARPAACCPPAAAPRSSRSVSGIEYAKPCGAPEMKNAGSPPTVSRSTFAPTDRLLDQRLGDRVELGHQQARAGVAGRRQAGARG